MRRQLPNYTPQQNRPFEAFCHPAFPPTREGLTRRRGAGRCLRPWQHASKFSIFLGRAVWQLPLRRFVFLLLLSGCMMGPNYEQPENCVSDEWATADHTEEEPLAEWWKAFDDPLLTQYIEKAAQYNEDLLAAEATVLQSMALRQVAAAKLFPQIGADLNAGRIGFSKNGLFFANAPKSGPAAAASPLTPVQSLYTAVLDATWEIDIFGKTRRSVEAAEAQIGSAIEQRNDILLSIMAEIASNYISLRSNQRLLQLTQENIDLLEKNAAILFQSLERGYVNKIDYESIEAQLATARAALPALIAQIYKEIYAISVLTGEMPETLLPELLPVRALPAVPRSIAIGLKSDLLRRRPDVRYAERQLAAATANIGVAIASFFPSVTLLGFGGVQSVRIHDLFNQNSKTWVIDGNISIPIFQGGQLIGNLHANEEAAKSAAHHYQQTVLNAVSEAESSLIAYTQDLQTTSDFRDAVQKNSIIVGLTEQRYEKGLVGLISLLSAKRQLISAEESLLSSETTSLTDLISLYKALGGGWQIEEECRTQNDD